MRILSVLIMVVILTGCKPPTEWIQEAPPPVTVVAVGYGSIILADGNGEMDSFSSEWSRDVSALCKSYAKGDVVKAGEPPEVQKLKAQLAEQADALATEKLLAEGWRDMAYRFSVLLRDAVENPHPIVVTCAVENASAPVWKECSETNHLFLKSTRADGPERNGE